MLKKFMVLQCSAFEAIWNVSMMLTLNFHNCNCRIRTAVVCIRLGTCSEGSDSPTNSIPILGRCWMRRSDWQGCSAQVHVVLGSMYAFWLCFPGEEYK